MIKTFDKPLILNFTINKVSYFHSVENELLIAIFLQQGNIAFFGNLAKYVQAGQNELKNMFPRFQKYILDGIV